MRLVSVPRAVEWSVHSLPSYVFINTLLASDARRDKSKRMREAWSSIQNADMVIGGCLDLGQDFTYTFSFRTLRLANADLRLSFRKGPLYLDSPSEYLHLVESLKKLSKQTCIYPPPQETIAFADKSRLIDNLDSIANSVTHTARPSTEHLPYLHPLPSDRVLKRSFVSTKRHVYIPSQKNLYPGDERYTITRDWDTLGKPAFFQTFWLTQTYNELLRDPRYGQVMVLMLQGEVCYVGRKYARWKDGNSGTARTYSQKVTRALPLEDIK